MLKQMVLSFIIVSGMIHSMDDTERNKKRKRYKMTTSDIVESKRVKILNDGFVMLNSICPKCDREWLVQIDKCPGCGEPTSLGVGYEIHHT